MSTKRLFRNNKGQMRILEAVVAATIIFLAFSGSTFLIQSSDIKVSQVRHDLDKIGYNVVTRMVDSGIIESTIESVEEPLTIQLQSYLQNALPLSTYFNLTISKFVPNSLTQWTDQTSPIVSINNAQNDGSVFIRSNEVSSTLSVYTSKGGYTYNIVLVLIVAGAGR